MYDSTKHTCLEHNQARHSEAIQYSVLRSSLKLDCLDFFAFSYIYIYN